MRYSFFWISAAFTCGILLARVPGTGPFYPWFLLFGVIPVLWVSRGRKLFLPFLLLGVAGAGFLHARAEAQRPPNAVENYAASPGQISLAPFSGRVLLRGRVHQSPVIKQKGKRVRAAMVLEAESLLRWKDLPEPFDGDGVQTSAVKESVSVSGKVQVFLYQPSEIPEVGDSVLIAGNLERPRPALNPGQFDYARYLGERNVFAVLKGYGYKSVRILEPNGKALFPRGVEALRGSIERRIDRLFAPRHGAVFKALILGMRGEIPRDLRKNFVRTGTAHLLAISGLHVTLVAGTAYALMLFLGIPRKCGVLLSLAALGGYVLIAGCGLPVLRAGFMLGLFFLSVLLGRDRNPVNLFFAVYFAFLVASPRSLGSISFQLSFLSVLGLLLFFSGQHGRLSRKLFMDSSLVVSVVLTPILIRYFHIFSWVHWPSNFLAIPLFHMALLFSLVSVFLSGIPFLAGVTSGLAEFWAEAGIRWINFLGGWRWSCFFLASPGIGPILFYYLTLGIFFTGRVVKPGLTRWLWPLAASGMLTFAGAVVYKQASAGRDFEINVLAAGKNEIGHISFGSGQEWLINTGRGLPADQGEWLLLPYLQSRGTNRLEGVLVTGTSGKYTGGLASLSREIRSKYLIFPGKSPKNFKCSGLAASKESGCVGVYRGDRIFIGRGVLEVLTDDHGKLGLIISYPGCHVLWLTELREDLIIQLQVFSRRLLNIDLVVMPAQEALPVGAVKLLAGIVKRAVWVASSGGLEVKQALREAEIPFYDLEEAGAFRLSLVDGQRRFFSMLTGELSAIT